MKIFELYVDACNEINTHQGGILKPNTNFVTWVHTISIEIWEELVAEYEKSSAISDKLNPFTQRFSVLVESVKGEAYDIARFPKGYNRYINAKIKTVDNKCGCAIKEAPVVKCGEICKSEPIDDLPAEEIVREIPVTKVPQSKWSGAVNRTKKPSFEKPVCTQIAGSLQVAPKGVGFIILSFFKLPVKPVFNYTILNPGQETEYIQFDATDSVDLEWSDDLKPEFIRRLKEKYTFFNA